MSWPLQEKFPRGAPLRDLVTTEVMETIAGVLNSIMIEVIPTLTRPRIVKTAVPSAQNPWKIQIPPSGNSADTDCCRPVFTEGKLSQIIFGKASAFAAYDLDNEVVEGLNFVDVIEHAECEAPPVE